MRSAKQLHTMIWICVVLLTFSTGSIGLPPLAGAQKAASIDDIIENFQTSLHGTRIGKDTYYSNPISPSDPHMGGFYNLTGVPMDDLGCKNCHGPTYADGTPIDPATYQPSCRDCHEVEGPGGPPVADSACLSCHSRQQVEHMFFSDVHRDRGLGCTDCHTVNEMHGDGTPYTSLQEPGALEVNCEQCHPVNQLKPHKSHKHVATVDCTACHVKSVIACNNCHFESVIEGNKNRFYAPPMHDFKMLMRSEEGKVHSASFQSLTFEGKTFYVLAPFATHSITTDIACTDCHLQGPKKAGARGSPKNAPINEYVETGMITVTRWDEASKLLIGTKGVIPVPPDWKEALQFDFVDYDGLPTDPVVMDPSKWSYLKTGADMLDMPFGQPLTEGQMWHLIHSR